MQRLKNRSYNRFYAHSLRARLAVSCRDSDPIPKVEGAGSIVGDLLTPGLVQIMHNGIEVPAGQYGSTTVQKIISELNGHHEPQEEWVFHNLLPHMGRGSRILELGCYWGYYSTWFAKAVPDAKIVLNDINLTRMSFAVSLMEKNNLFAERKFLGYIGHDLSVDFIVGSVGEIDLLHSDIQGYETLMLKGAQTGLRRHLIKRLLISTHRGKHTACKKMLLDAGYLLDVDIGFHQSYQKEGILLARSPDQTEVKVEVSKKPVWKLY